MRHRIAMFVLGAWLGAWASPAASEGDSDGPPPPALLSDPSLATSVYFPPTTTTAGVANTGQAIGQMKRGGCTVLMPCAVTSPALDHAVIARP